MFKYKYDVPREKQDRVIIYTDCANEVDDQFTVAHILMTPKFDVRGIVAGHFDYYHKNGVTATRSYNEILKVLDLMKLNGKYNVALGSELPLTDDKTPILSDGAKLIIEEAMKEDERPLYILCQGSITDLASAILVKPEICDKMTAIWIGGADYPNGGGEFNLMQDVNAANILFSSTMPVWQITTCVYKSLSISFAEMQLKIEPCGEIGKYLFENVIRYNNELKGNKLWPHGELWGLGDQGVVAALMQEREKDDNYEMIKAPYIDPVDMTYDFNTDNREIRVYKSLDVRLTMEDMFAKFAINYKD